MNWRGRISVALGVLLLVGLPVWHFFPRWIAWQNESLDLNTAHFRTTQYILFIPVWYETNPSFIAKQLKLPERDDSQPPRWLKGRPYLPYNASSTYLAMIERSIDNLRMKGIPAKVRKRLEFDMATIFFHLMHKQDWDTFAGVWTMSEYEIWDLVTAHEPRLFVLKKINQGMSLTVEASKKWDPDQPIISFLERDPLANIEFPVRLGEDLFSPDGGLPVRRPSSPLSVLNVEISAGKELGPLPSVEKTEPNSP